MKTLTRKKKRVEYVDSILSEEQWNQISPILEEIKHRRQMGIEKCYTLEEVMKELNEMIEEDENNRIL